MRGSMTSLPCVPGHAADWEDAGPLLPFSRHGVSGIPGIPLSARRGDHGMNLPQEMAAFWRIPHTFCVGRPRHAIHGGAVPVFSAEDSYLMFAMIARRKRHTSSFER